MALIKIETYTVIANPVTESYSIRMNLDTKKYYVTKFKNLTDLNVIVEILRNEDNCFLSEKNHDIIVGKEPVGENDIW